MTQNIAATNHDLAPHCSPSAVNTQIVDFAQQTTSSVPAFSELSVRTRNKKFN